MDPNYSPASPSTASALLLAGGSNSTANSPLVPFGMVIDGQLGSNTDTITLTVSSLASGLGGNPAQHNLVNGRWGTSSTVMPGMCGDHQAIIKSADGSLCVPSTPRLETSAFLRLQYHPDGRVRHLALGCLCSLQWRRPYLTLQHLTCHSHLFNHIHLAILRLLPRA